MAKVIVELELDETQVEGVIDLLNSEAPQGYQQTHTYWVDGVRHRVLKPIEDDGVEST